MKKYQIFQHDFYDENCEHFQTLYSIKIRKKFLFFSYWITVMRTDLGWNESVNNLPKYFRIYEEAIEAAERMIKGIEPNSIITKRVN